MNEIVTLRQHPFTLQVFIYLQDILPKQAPKFNIYAINSYWKRYLLWLHIFTSFSRNFSTGSCRGSLFACNQLTFRVCGGLAHSILDSFRVYSLTRFGFTTPNELLLPVTEPHQPFSGNSICLLGYRGDFGDKSPPPRNWPQSAIS